MDISCLKLSKIKTIYDKRGNLSIIEGNKDIKFEILRIYYIWNNLINYPRGGHAHKKLYQALIAVHGSCKLTIDDGIAKKDFILNNADECLLIYPGLWRDLREFSHDCVLLVLASEYYDENDYIRDYDEYLNYVKSN